MVSLTSFWNGLKVGDRLKVMKEWTSQDAEQKKDHKAMQERVIVKKQMNSIKTENKEGRGVWMEKPKAKEVTILSTNPVVLKIDWSEKWDLIMYIGKNMEAVR